MSANVSYELASGLGVVAGRALVGKLYVSRKSAEAYLARNGSFEDVEGYTFSVVAVRAEGGVRYAVRSVSNAELRGAL